jgi:AraC family transcriptional regulator, transcriptional activator of the genes for pyochelin and ferripyochelin receptors
MKKKIIDDIHQSPSTEGEIDHEPLLFRYLLMNDCSTTWQDGQLTELLCLLQKLRFCTFKGRLSKAGAIPRMGMGTGVVLLFMQCGSLHVGLNGPSNLRIDMHTHTTFFAGNLPIVLESEDLEFSGFWVEIEPQYFLSLAGECGELWETFANDVALGNATRLFPVPLQTDIALQACLRQLQVRMATVQGNALLYRAKAMEILALQEENWQQQHGRQPVHVKTDYDRERLAFARNYLGKNMATPPSLTELAAIAGINEFKLKNGFKELYGNTVFGYLADLRLALAQEALQAGRKTATEIAFDLGYSSLQHFSSRFKEKYGVTPTELRNRSLQK